MVLQAALEQTPRGASTLNQGRRNGGTGALLLLLIGDDRFHLTVGIVRCKPTNIETLCPQRKKKIRLALFRVRSLSSGDTSQ